MNTQKLPTAQDARPLLSILIPTKDRYSTLSAVVEQICSSITDNRLEIVVCDNSSIVDSQALTKIKSDPRVTYAHSSNYRSIVENTEVGIAMCSGDYICFIGDDDLVSPFIMQAVAWLKSCGEECLIYPPARYWWANVLFARESRSQRPGAFWLPKDRCGTIARHQSDEELIEVLRRGGVAYLNLPRLYHGVVSRNAMEEVRQRFGRYVPGSSPDMALSIALAITQQNYVAISYPLSVFGAARNSGGGWTAARKHYGKIADQSHLPPDILDNWDPHLPKIWSEQVIYPQTIFEVFSSIGQIPEINYDAFYASLIAYEPHIFQHLRPVLREYISEDRKRLKSLSVELIKKVLGRSRLALKSKTGVGMAYDLFVRANLQEVVDLINTIPSPALSTEHPR